MGNLLATLHYFGLHTTCWLLYIMQQLLQFAQSLDLCLNPVQLRAPFGIEVVDLLLLLLLLLVIQLALCHWRQPLLQHLLLLLLLLLLMQSFLLLLLLLMQHFLLLLPLLLLLRVRYYINFLCYQLVGGAAACRGVAADRQGGRRAQVSPGRCHGQLLLLLLLQLLRLLP